MLKSGFLAAASAVLVSSCATYSATYRYWDEPAAREWRRDGRVQWVRETDRVVEGNPGAGAAAGAVVGGLLGAAITGHGLGALVGAAGGAAVGAESSRSSSTRRYDVLVRFDDGGSELFSFAEYPPFHAGEAVRLTPSGLMVLADASVPSSPAPQVVPPSPAPSTPAPPPAYELSSAPQVRAPPPGQWVYTQQYGWVWMPYADRYTYAPTDGDSDPRMYVYIAGGGWTWVVAPWVWGWGPRPWLGRHAVTYYAWCNHGWGSGWYGYRPAPYRYGFVYHGRIATRGATQLRYRGMHHGR